MQRRDNRYILKMELRGWRKKRKITETEAVVTEDMQMADVTEEDLGIV